MMESVSLSRDKISENQGNLYKDIHKGIVKILEFDSIDIPDNDGTKTSRKNATRNVTILTRVLCQYICMQTDIFNRQHKEDIALDCANIFRTLILEQLLDFIENKNETP